MMRDLSAGPVAGAAWIPYTAAGTTGTPILAVPDAANAQRAATGLPELYHGLPAVPQVARDAAGQPVLSLSLLLTRRPTLEDEDIFGLVDSAALACDLTLALPPGAADGTLRPLFARGVRMALVADDGGGGSPRPLVEAQGWGSETRTALGTRLDRDAAQAVLKALNGQESGLSVSCEVGYRSGGERRDVRMLIRWAAVHDIVSLHLDEDGGLNDSVLRALLPAMIEDDALQAWSLEAGQTAAALPAAQADALWRPFMMFSSMLLAPAVPPGIVARFTLRDRPDDDARLDTRVTLDTARDETTTLAATLEAVLGKVLDGLDADRFIHLTCVDPHSPGGVGPVPRRVRSTSPSRGAAQAASAGLLMVGANAVSPSLALQPDSRTRAPAGALLASNAAILHPGATHAFYTNCWDYPRITESDEPVLPLPRVDDPNGALWNDAADANHVWYAPEYTLVAPEQTGDPASSSFGFSFHESGHDAAGRPTLEGSVRVKLRAGMSAATAQALQARAGVRADPVPATSLTASLSLPMRDDSGHPRRVDLPAVLSVEGELVTAQVALLNDYVRVAYGDLAFAGFQSEPARLQLAYTFDALVLVSQFPAQFLKLQNVDKLQVTPVAYTLAQQKQLGGQAHVDAMQMRYRGLAADMQFRRESAVEPAREVALADYAADARQDDNRGSGGGYAARTRGASGPFDEDTEMSFDADSAQERSESAFQVRAPVLNNLTLAQRPAAAGLQFAATALTPGIRPELESSARWQQIIAQRRYARQVQGRSAAFDLLFPCSTHGALYRQERDGDSIAVGCQDTFSLGQAPLKLYEAVSDPALASPKYKVYRSMAQPGRYLVLPSTYLITRYSSAEGERAWRPTIYLYSTLDPVTPANNRCILMAALQPDLTPLEREQLAGKLAHPSRETRIEYPTEIDSEVQFTWALPAGGTAVGVEATRLSDNFQVTLATDRAGVLLLQSMLTHTGLSGQARFKLGDGTVLSSALRLDLNHLAGPWDGGPVEVALGGKRATLTNRIERPVDLAQLLVKGPGKAEAWVACDRTLKAGESATLDLPFDADRGWTAHSLPPGDPATLAVINSFVENIGVNAVFVSLVDFPTRGLAALSLVARIKEAAGGDTTLTLSPEHPVGEAKFLLPLTLYEGPRTLQFQVTKTDTAGAVTLTAWLETDLAASNVVSLVWDLIK